MRTDRTRIVSKTLRHIAGLAVVLAGLLGCRTSAYVQMYHGERKPAVDIAMVSMRPVNDPNSGVAFRLYTVEVRPTRSISGFMPVDWKQGQQLPVELLPGSYEFSFIFHKRFFIPNSGTQDRGWTGVTLASERVIVRKTLEPGEKYAVTASGGPGGLAAFYQANLENEVSWGYWWRGFEPNGSELRWFVDVPRGKFWEETPAHGIFAPYRFEHSTTSGALTKLFVKTKDSRPPRYVPDSAQQTPLQDFYRLAGMGCNYEQIWWSETALMVFKSTDVADYRAAIEAVP